MTGASSGALIRPFGGHIRHSESFGLTVETFRLESKAYSRSVRLYMLFSFASHPPLSIRPYTLRPKAHSSLLFVGCQTRYHPSGFAMGLVMGDMWAMHVIPSCQFLRCMSVFVKLPLCSRQVTFYL